MNINYKQIAGSLIGNQISEKPIKGEIFCFDEEELQKFAELIVKECTTYINSRTEDWDAKLHWVFNDGSGYMEVDIDLLLNEHFGIK